MYENGVGWAEAGLERYQGGFSTKIHATTLDENCVVALHLRAGQAHDRRQFLYESLDPDNVLEFAALDRGYDADRIRKRLAAAGIESVISLISTRSQKPRTTRNATGAATASNASSTNSNRFAASPPATTNWPKPSSPRLPRLRFSHRQKFVNIVSIRGGFLPASRPRKNAGAALLPFRNSTFAQPAGDDLGEGVRILYRRESPRLCAPSTRQSS